MELPTHVIEELKTALELSFGKEAVLEYSDSEINELGNLLLTTLAEGLKLKANRKLTTK